MAIHQANRADIETYIREAEQNLNACLTTVIAHAVQNNIREAEQAFKRRIDDAIEAALQELLSTADDATDHMNQQAESLIRDMIAKRDDVKASWKDAPLKPSKLFPNVDVSKFTSAPAATTSGFLDTKNKEPLETALEWGKDGPTNNSEPNAIPQQVQFHSLPPVCHTDMLKRVHLPYPGHDQSYLWYLQLKSNGTQYRVYLIATEDFKKDKSLCPTEVYGIRIDHTRYNEMKCTLYHFLAQRTIITTEFTDLQNIINRNAMTTDGYRVLYDIKARIHPLLILITHLQRHKLPTTVIYMNIICTWILTLCMKSIQVGLINPVNS
jgi:hypothetical protein